MNSKEHEKTLSSMIKKYIKEVIEAYIAFTIYKIIINNSDITLESSFKNIKAAMIIGAVTFALEYYDSSYKSIVKNGMAASIGSQLIKNING